MLELSVVALVLLQLKRSMADISLVLCLELGGRAEKKRSQRPQSLEKKCWH